VPGDDPGTRGGVVVLPRKSGTPRASADISRQDA
jgi:hypothetical protein